MQTKVVFLEDNDDLQKLMSLVLKSKLGIDCKCFSHLSDFESHEQDVLDRDLAILDINLGPDEPSGLDAFQWLKDHRFKGKIVFLTGHAKSNPLVARALTTGAQVLEKPLKTDKLVATIQKMELH